MSDDAVLAAEGVRKAYGEAVALDGVSLSVASGETYALVGPNGAGKTTLIRCLTGTTTPDDGTIELFGRSPGEIERSRIGLLPQDYAPPDRLSARELVRYYAGLYDDPRDPSSTLADVGLDPDDDTKYGDLSGGQQRRACVAAALVADPDVLFLDEPTTAVDPAGRRALWDLFESLSDRGTTIVLTTHDMAEAERLADHVGLLAAGRLVESGSPADLIAAHGGAARLVVETDADPAALADAEFDPVRTEAGLVFEGLSPARIGDVVAAFEARGIDFESLAWREPDLEDAYLSLADDVARADLEGAGGRTGRPNGERRSSDDRRADPTAEVDA